MTMDIIDKRIYSCNEAICKNIESLQANERGLLSQNILSQLRNFLECVFLKIYVASGNSLIEYTHIMNFLFIGLQILILHQRFPRIQLFQFIIGFVFGFLLDVNM